MRAVVQRAVNASVSVDGTVVGSIPSGLVVLVGFADTDTPGSADTAGTAGTAAIEWMADKLLTLRIFPDEEGKMNRNVQEAGGGLLLISQFTLYGDLKKGTRPSFIKAAPASVAEPLFNSLVQRLRSLTQIQIETGVFGAMMQVTLTNDGPVTLTLER